MHPLCTNCNQAINQEQNFCANCGQKAHLHRLSWHDISHDAIHYFTHADKGIFHLLIQLVTKTGTVAREFVEGKRKKYFPPFNFFLIVAAIYVFVSTLNTKPKVPTDVLKEHPDLIKIPDAKKRQHVVKIYERAAKAGVFMKKHSNSISMVAVPLIAVIFWLFYRRSGYNYVEHLVANMYMAPFTLLCHVLIFLPVGFLLNIKNPNYVLIAFFIFQIIYFSIFYYHFINSNNKSAGIKAFFVSLFAVVFWGALSVTLIRLYITNGFWGLLN